MMMAEIVIVVHTNYRVWNLFAGNLKPETEEAIPPSIRPNHTLCAERGAVVEFGNFGRPLGAVLDVVCAQIEDQRSPLLLRWGGVVAAEESFFFAEQHVLPEEGLHKLHVASGDPGDRHGERHWLVGWVGGWVVWVDRSTVPVAKC